MTVFERVAIVQRSVDLYLGVTLYLRSCFARIGRVSRCLELVGLVKRFILVVIMVER